MNKRKTYTRIITAIYAVTLILTVLSFLVLGYSESQFRFVISILAVLLAESVVYGYCLFWLRAASNIQLTSPVVISGAIITCIYAISVFVSAIVFDWVLEVPPSWYAAVQLVILIIGMIGLAITGLYGRNAGAQEQQSKRSLQGFKRYQSDLAAINELVGTWKNPESEQLVELLNTLEDNFRFSDPVSDPSLCATEDIMCQQISLLNDHVELLLATDIPHVGWLAEINEMTDNINATLQRRNRELLALK